MQLDLITRKEFDEMRNLLMKRIDELEKQSLKINQQGKWVDNKGLKKMIPISDSTIRRLRIDGKLISSPVGNKHFYKVEEVNKYIESCKMM